MNYLLKSWSFKKATLNLKPAIGYKYRHWGWEEIGGTFSYKKGADVGSFPDDRLGITYDVAYHIPYIGLGVDFDWSGWDLGAHAHYSPFAYGQDKDRHILRDIISVGTCNKGQWWGVGASVGRNLGKNLHLGLSYDYERLHQVKGSMEAVGFFVPIVQIADEAGMSYKTHTVGLALTYKF